MKQAYNKIAAKIVFALILISGTVNAQSWQWLNRAGGTAGGETGRAACTDAAGNAYFCGNFNGASIAFGSFSLSTAGSNDIFIAKFNAAGVCQWAVRAGGTTSDVANGIATDGTSVYVTGGIGSTPGGATFGPFTLNSNGAASDGFIAKLDAATGGWTWAVNFSNTSTGGDIGHAITLDGSGNPYICGNFSSTINFGSASYTSSGAFDFFVARVSPVNGAFVWGAVGGGTAGDNVIGSSLCYVPGLNEIVAASSFGSNATYYTTTPASGPFNFTNSGGNDIVLLELNAATGGIVSALQHSGAGGEDCMGMCYDPATTNVMLTGYFASASITFGATTLTNGGGEDIFIASYNPSANSFPWALRAGGASNERGWSVSSSGNGVIAVTGMYTSSPTTFGSTSLTSAGAADVFVAAIVPSSGAYVWAIAAQGSDGAIDDIGRGIAYTTNGSGNVYVTGQFAGGVSNPFTAGSFTAVSAGSVDIFFAKLLAPPPLVATQTQVNLTCNGVCTGSATVVASGGVAPYTYSWSPSGGSGATASNLCAINYTVTITDAVSTSITKTFSITQPPAIVITPVSQTNVSCFNGTNGAAQVTASGGTGSLTYNWTPGNPTGDGTGSVSGLTAQVYTVTVTDANTCTATRTFNITQPSTAVTGTVAVTNVSCNGGSNGAIDLTPSGGSPGYTYFWQPSGPTTQDRSGLTQGTYTVVISDANSCTVSVTASVTQPPALATPTASSNTPVCSGNTINLSTPSVAGATYSWTGPNSFSSTSQNPVITNATVAMAGTYSVTYTVGGCTSPVGTTAVVVNATPATPTPSSNSPVCTGNTISLTTSTVAGATYTWTGPNSFSSSVQNPTITNATTAMAGTYSVTVTTNGCTSAVGTTVVAVNTIPATPTASSNTPVCTGNTINLTTSTVAGATYTWTGPNSFSSSVQNPNITNATVAMAGTYSVTVTTNGCTSGVGTTAVVVNATPATPTPSSNTPVCTGNTINLMTSTVAGATYSWIGPNSFSSSAQNPSITNATVAMAGSYSVQVTVNGCASSFAPTTVVVNATPATPAPSSNTPVCTGNTINLTTSTVAGATYTWTGPNSFSSSVQNPNITNATVAMAGTYSLTVTTNGCTSGVGTTAVVVNATPATPAPSSNSPVCTGNTISLTASTVAGATYSWTGPNSFSSAVQNPNITNATVAMAGTYSLTVTTNGCTSGIGTTAVVVNATPATPTPSSNTPVCTGNTINLTTSTVAGATYSWTGPNSFSSAVQNPNITNATVAMAGTYSLTVTTNGCTSGIGTTAVVVNATPATPAPSSNTPVCTGNTINLMTSTVAGATYTWTGPNSFSSSVQNPNITNATVAMAGTYSLTVTTNGCTSGVGTTAVVVNATPATPTPSSNTPVCTGNTINLMTSTVAGATYTWTGPNSFSSSVQNPSITNATVAMAGTYSLTVTTNGCTSGIGTTAVVVNATPATPAPSSNTPVCTGNTINLMTSTVAGATYTWTGPNSFSSSVQNPSITNATVAMAGTYSLTVTTNGCTSGVGTTAVVVNATPATPTASSNTPVCTGNTINLMTPTVAGATYSWTGPSSFSSAVQNPSRTNATVAMAGTYSVTVTTNGCTSAAGTTTVVVNTTPATPTASSNTPVCSGNTISLTTSTVAGATYAWTGPSSFSSSVQNPAITNATTAMSGTYSLTVTTNGCTSGIGTTTVFVNPSIVSTVSSTAVSCFGGSNGTATANVSGGSPGYTYVWTPSGGTNATATGLAAGPYSVLVTDAIGCTSTATTTITQPVAPLSGTTVVTNVACNGGTTGAIDLTPAGGTAGYSYFWLPSGPTTQDRINIAAGTYSVNITDANGCTVGVSATVTEPPVISITMTQTNVSCTGGNNGSATVVVTGGTPGYTYNWVPSGGNAATATGLIAGCYTVIVTDANGCTRTQTVCITEPIALSVSSTVTNVSCNGGSNGSVSVSVIGGTGAYTYSWAPSGGNAATATGLSATVYTVTVTDGNGCTITHSVALTEPSVITSVDTHTDITCFGANDGTADVVVSGGTPGYTYMWAPSGGTGSTATGLQPGLYTVTVTDANGCIHSPTFLIAEPSVLTATSTQTNVSCFGGTNGSASVSVSGGTGAYTYAWTSGGNTDTETALGMGSYTCTITDANGCSVSQTFSITEPAALAASGMQTNVSCFGGSNGDAMVMVSGGTPGYTYVWTPNVSATATATGLSAGTYSCEVTDANGCTLTETFTITEPNAITSTVSQSDVLCNGNATGSATVNVSGGTGAYTYLWTPGGGTNATESNLAAGTYTVDITDANGCTASVTVNITEPAAITSSVMVTNVTCNAGTDGAIDITVSGGTTSYTYDWNSGTYTSEDLTSVPAGAYVLLLTDYNGCTYTETVNVTEPAAIAPNAVVSNASSCTSNDGSIDLSTQGGNGVYTFLWNPNSETTEDISGLDGGVYSVVITDGNGCTASASFTITEPGAPVVTYSEPMDSACQTTTSVFTLSGESPAGGTWTGPGVSGNSFDPMTANLGYNVIIYSYTDGQGCSGSASDSIWVDLCQDVATHTNGTIFNVYPNPSAGQFTVNAAAGSVITVYDALGNVAISVRAINTKTEIDLSGFANGMYLVRVDSDNQSATERLLLNR